MNDGLQNYIKQMHEQEFSDERIRQELKKAGWADEMIDAEIKAYGQVAGSKPIQSTQMSSLKKESQGRKFGRPALYMIIAGVVFVVGAGGAFGALYTQMWSPSWNPFRPAPAELLADVRQNMDEVRLVDFDVDLAWSMRETEGEEVIGIKMGVDGTVDERVAGNSKTRASVQADVNYAGISFMLSGDIIYIESDPNFYLKLKNIPVLSLLELSQKTERLTGIWIAVDMDELDTDQSSEQFTDLYTRLLDDPQRYNLTEMEDTTIDGQSVYHYRFSVPKSDIGKSGELYELNELFGVFKERIPVDIWITKDTKLIKKFGVSTSIELGQDETSQGAKMPEPLSYLGAALNHSTTNQAALDDYPANIYGDLNATITVDLTTTLSYPEALSEEIQAPANTKTLEELFGTTSLGDREKRIRDTKRIGDLRQAQVALEVYFDDNGQYPPALEPGRCEDASRVLALVGLEGVVDPLETQSYSYGSSVTDPSDPFSFEYVLKTTLEDASHLALDSDIDGMVHGCDCDDPNYCASN